MARAREATKFYAGHRGYAVLPRPDILRPDDALACAENVWMMNGAGLCVRRGGQVACAIDGLDETVNGLLPFAYAPGITGAFAFGGVDAIHYTLNLQTNSIWTELPLPSAVEVTPDGGASIAGNLFPNSCASLKRKVVFSTPKGNDHTRLALFDIDAGTIRLAGFAVPAAPTAEDAGVASTYPATLRYYRVRFTTQASSVTVRRSEPSTSVSFTPSGTGTGVLVTRPVVLDEGETHWELEVSLDDANWYLLTTVAVGTTTYTDSADTATYSAGTVSEEPGARLAPGQCRSVITDRDRFVFGGHWTEPAYKNRVWFTPVLGTTDVADEETVPTDNYVDVAPGDDDQITALILGPGDDVLVFKERSIYRLLRTGVAAAPYQVSDAMVYGIGTRTPRHVCGGVDAAHNSCVYFSDTTGYWRYGLDGLTRLDGALHAGPVVPESSVVYYRTRRTVLFGALAFHIDTQGWSRMTWDVLHEHQIVTPHYLTDFDDTEGDRLFAPGTGLPSIRELDSGTTDIDFANETESFVARVGLSRRLLAAGSKWTPTRCAVWGTGGARLDVSVAVDGDPVTDSETVVEDALDLVGSVTLPATRDSALVSPQGLGVGSVTAVGIWLHDPPDASTAWTLDAVEVSGVPSEPLP